MPEINIKTLLLLADIVMLAKLFRRRAEDPERAKRLELAWVKVSEKTAAARRGKM